MNWNPPLQSSASSRRQFLWQLGGGLGGIALAQLLGRQQLLGATGGIAGTPVTGVLGGQLHHPPKVRRVIQLFMNGGASQMDLFDYKPALFKRHGETFDPGSKERVEGILAGFDAELRCPVRVHRDWYY